MTTFGALVLLGVGVAVVAFAVIVAQGRRLRLGEDRAKKREAIARASMDCRNKIADFGTVMEKEPLGFTDIADVGRLPHSKDELIAAFRLVVSMTNDQPLRGQLQTAALGLAQYQPGVGSQVLKQLHLPSREVFQRMTAEELAAAVLEGSADTDRWEQFNVRR